MQTIFTAMAGNRFIILLILALTIFATSCKQNKKTASPSNRHSSCNAHIPQYKGYINDFVFLFTEAERWQLDSIIGEHEKLTTNQIAIFTFDSSMMGKCRLEEYTLSVGNTWGVGQKDKNNGVIVGIAPAFRTMRIENGLGIEKILSNEETQKIIDSNFLPYFKKAEYFEGTKKGLLALIEKIK